MRTKKSRGKELTPPQIAELSQMIAAPHPDAVGLLVKKALDAIYPDTERMGLSFGRDIQQALAEHPSMLNLICALGPRDVAEVMLISQFVVLHVKGMKSFRA